MEERYSRRILLLKQVMITEEKLRILKTLIRKLFLWKIGKKIFWLSLIQINLTLNLMKWRLTAESLMLNNLLKKT